MPSRGTSPWTVPDTVPFKPFAYGHGPMDFSELMTVRYSCRGFTDTKVSEEDIASIAEAGRIAPSAKNLQPTRVFAITDATALEKVGKLTRIYNAPLAFIVCGDKGLSWKRDCDGMDSYQIDASIVATQMMYRATELGLGTLYICWFDPKDVIQDIGIPSNLEPVSILAVGHPSVDDSPNHMKRIDVDTFMTRI